MTWKVKSNITKSLSLDLLSLHTFSSFTCFFGDLDLFSQSDFKLPHLVPTDLGEAGGHIHPEEEESPPHPPFSTLPPFFGPNYLISSFDLRKKEAESHCFFSSYSPATPLARRKVHHRVLKICSGFISQVTYTVGLLAISSKTNFSLSFCLTIGNQQEIYH